MPDVVQHDFLRHSVQHALRARRQVGEFVLDGLFQFLAPVTGERPVAQVEAELAALLADEVHDGQHGLALGAAQPAPQLLEEDRGALCGAEQQDGVHLRQVQAFVEEVDGEDAVDLP